MKEILVSLGVVEIVCVPSRMGELLSSYSSSSSSQAPANSLYVCSLCLQYLKLFFNLK